MRSDRPVGADLSGGLDSSAIVCLAHSLFKKGVLPKNGFETFSLMFPDHKEADESKYINDAIKMWDIQANLLTASNDHSVYAKIRRAFALFSKSAEWSHDGFDESLSAGKRNSCNVDRYRWRRIFDR